MRIIEIITKCAPKLYSSRCWGIIFLMLFLPIKMTLADSYPEMSEIAKIVPPITLESVTGERWNTSNYVNKEAVTLIMIGNEPHIETSDDTQDSIVSAISQAITKSQSPNLKIITVIERQFSSSNKIKNTTRFLQKAKALNLHYAQESVYKLFSASPHGITLVAIDKAGFLRQVEKLPVSYRIEAAIARSIKFQPSLIIGNIAPDFSVLTADQYRWRLADFRGWKKVLLLFMPDEMTCGCQNPVPSLQAKQSELDKNDVEVFIVSATKENTDNLISSSMTRFDFVTDSNRNLHYLYYGAEAQTTTDVLAVLIDKNGVVKEIVSGSDPANFEDNIIDKIINMDSK